MPFYGAVVACADDAELCAVLPRFKRRVITYGIDRGADARRSWSRDRRDARRLRIALHGRAARAPRRRRHRTLGELTLPVPGRHSVQNALAAVAVGLELDVPFARSRRRSRNSAAPSGASSSAA